MTSRFSGRIFVTLFSMLIVFHCSVLLPNQGCTKEPGRTYPQALDELNADTRQYPYDYQGRLDLGRTLSRKNYHDTAIEVFNNLLEEDPGNADVLFFRGRTYAWSNQFELAERDFRRVLERSPVYTDAWHLLGNVYRWENRPDSAIEAYNHWIDHAPDQPTPYIKRGGVFRKKGQYERASADFEKARELGADPAEIPPLYPLLTTGDESYKWEGRAGYRWTDLSAGRDNWTQYHASLQRNTKFGSYRFEAFRAQHFSVWNTGLLADIYRDLFPSNYVNVRFQVSPEADFLPQTDLLIEDYQMLGSGWEGSLGYRIMNFENTDVDIGKIGLGRYWGNWYGRGVYRRIIKPSATGNVYSLSLRRYLGNSDNYFEVRGSTGEELVEASSRNPALTLQTQSVGATYHFFVNNHSGFEFNFDYVDPDRQALRRAFEINYIRRW